MRESRAHARTPTLPIVPRLDSYVTEKSLNSATSATLKQLLLWEDSHLQVGAELVVGGGNVC